MHPALEWIRSTYIYDSGHLYCRSTGTPVRQSITIAGQRLYTSYAIWFYMHGELPEEGIIIDHKNRDRKDDRISNLREANYIQNGYNKISPINHNGLKGITPSGRPGKPWLAQIRIEGTKINLGRFKTKEEAAEAYRQAAIKYHGEFVCLN